MVPLVGEHSVNPEGLSQTHGFVEATVPAQSAAGKRDVSNSGLRGHTPGPVRRTPRVSLIVVLPENHVLSPDRLAEGLRAHENQDIDVVVACAGQPTNLGALQRTVKDAQFLLAPAGTSTQDLRALAMRQAPGDIVTLLSGALRSANSIDESLEMTS
jgi:hypothetical protein